MKSFASEMYCRIMVYEKPTAILAWLLGGEAFRELLVSGKEPGRELIELPVAPEQRQEVRREHHQAITFPLALAHVDHHPLGVDVGALELTEFGDAEARGIEGSED